MEVGEEEMIRKKGHVSGEKLRHQEEWRCKWGEIKMT